MVDERALTKDKREIRIAQMNSVHVRAIACFDSEDVQEAVELLKESLARYLAGEVGLQARIGILDLVDATFPAFAEQEDEDERD